MKQFFTFLLAICSMWVTAQNQINPITITLPANPPANTAEWATALPPVMIMAQAKMQNGQINPMVVESKILVAIKNGAGKICGMYNQQNAPMSNFNAASKNWTGANVLSLLGQECTLQPGSYELCVKFIGPNMASGTAVLGEACKAFTIIDTKQQVYNAPQNISPANEKIFNSNDQNAPITFRWTPVLPKPKDPVTYRLKVWQLMQGQSGAQAMRSNPPIVTKDVDNITQAIVANVITGPCRPPYLCDFVWNIQALDKDGKPIGNNNGTSELSSWRYGANQTSSITIIAPADKMEINPKDANAINFRWTPIVPKPKDPVTYRLKVWQLMQGQSGTTAMRTNKPIVVKDVDNITEATLSNIYTGPCRPPYLCDFVWNVEALSKDGNPIGNNNLMSELSSFSIAATQTSSIKNIAPANKMEIAPKDANAITFRWTPVIPKPTDPVTYRLKVWQLMQGQSGTEAMRSKLPIVVKDVDNITEATLSNIYTGPCRPPYLCDFVWQVEALVGQDKTVNKSEPSTFSIGAKVASVCPGTWGAIQFGTSTGLGTTLTPGGGVISTLNMGSTYYFNTCFTCGTSCITPIIEYEFIDAFSFAVVGGTLTSASCATIPITVPTFTSTAIHSLKIKVDCCGTICDSVTYQIPIAPSITPTCCIATNWTSQLWGNTSTASTALPASPGLFPSMTSGSTIYFNVSHTCAAGCVGPAQIDYIFTNTSGTSTLATFTSPTGGLVPVTIPTTTGPCLLFIIARCGTDTCDTLKYQSTIINNCCLGWGTKKWNNAAPPTLPLPASYSLLGTVNTGAVLNFNVTYNCAPGCAPATIKYQLINPVGGAVLASSTVGAGLASLPIPTVASGTYLFKIYAFCGGNTPCDSLIYKIIINNCCTGSSWGTKKFHRWGTPPLLWSPLTCSNSFIGTLKRNRPHTFKVCYNCPIGCTSSITYEIYNGLGTVVAATTILSCPLPATIIIPNSVPFGNYTIKFTAYCGGAACNVCMNRFTLIP